MDGTTGRTNLLDRVLIPGGTVPIRDLLSIEEITQSYSDGKTVKPDQITDWLTDVELDGTDRNESARWQRFREGVIVMGLIKLADQADAPVDERRAAKALLQVFLADFAKRRRMLERESPASHC